MASATDEMTCYRHPSRETAVSCSSCGRPICPDCMTPTPVGMRCPECSKDRTQVRTVRSLNAETTTVTVALIAVNVILFLASGQFGAGGGGAVRLQVDLGLFGPEVHNGQWYRLVTSGFLHEGFIHIGFNMYLLWQLGRLLEGSMGSARFGGLYFASLLCGSLGALIFEPLALTIGASGAVFGLMGAAFFLLRSRGISVFSTGIGPLILINLAFSVLPGTNISLGGHLGGLIGGSLCALALIAVERRRLPGWAGYVAIAVIGAAGAAAAVLVSGSTSGIGV